MSTRILFLLICGMTALNVALLTINVATMSHATVAGKDAWALEADYDFKSAVESIVEGCTVDGENISC